jgi:hypothetical protein
MLHIVRHVRSALAADRCGLRIGEEGSSASLLKGDIDAEDRRVGERTMPSTRRWWSTTEIEPACGCRAASDLCAGSRKDLERFLEKRGDLRRSEQRPSRLGSERFPPDPLLSTNASGSKFGAGGGPNPEASLLGPAAERR